MRKQTIAGIGSLICRNNHNGGAQKENVSPVTRRAGEHGSSTSCSGKRNFVFYGFTRSTSGIGLSGAAVGIARLKRRVVPSNVHAPSLQREVVSIGFPSRTRSAFAVASRSAR